MTTTEMPSYTVGELEQETGFDRRTIAYYVQEGLLPRVGRRGPRTRYPRLVRDRLLFIRRVREAEEEGRVPPVSLNEIRKMFERISPALIAGVANGRIAVTPELVEEASTAFRLPEMRRVALRRRLESRVAAAERPRLHGSVAREPPEELVASPASEPPEDMISEPSSPRRAYSRSGKAAEVALANALLKLRKRARRRRKEDPTAMDTWTRIEVTSDIALSVRGLTEDDRKLVERVRRAMRRVIRPGYGTR